MGCNVVEADVGYGEEKHYTGNVNRVIFTPPAPFSPIWALGGELFGNIY